MKTDHFLLELVLLALFFYAPNTLFAFLGFEYLPYFVVAGLLVIGLVTGRMNIKKNRLRFTPPSVLLSCFWFGAILFIAGALARLSIGYQVFNGWIAGALLYLGCIPLVLATRNAELSVKRVVSILIPVLFIQYMLHLSTQLLHILPTYTYWEEAGRWYSPIMGQAGSPGPREFDFTVPRFHSWFSESNNVAFYAACLTIAEVLMSRRKRFVAMGLVTLFGTFSLHAIFGLLAGLLFIRQSRWIIIAMALLLGSTLLLPQLQFISFNRVGTLNYLLEAQTETVFRIYDVSGILGIKDLVFQETLFGLDPLYSIASVGMFGVAFLALVYGSLLLCATNRFLLPFIPLLIAASSKQVPLIFTPTLFSVLVMTSLAFAAHDAKKRVRILRSGSASPVPAPA